MPVKPNKPLILTSLLLAAFAINLDTTIVNVALPSLVTELDASTTQLSGSLMPTTCIRGTRPGRGNLGDRVGRKGVLLAGLAYSESPLSPEVGLSPGDLIAARAAMGMARR